MGIINIIVIVVFCCALVYFIIAGGFALFGREHYEQRWKHALIATSSLLVSAFAFFVLIIATDLTAPEKTPSGGWIETTPKMRWSKSLIPISETSYVFKDDLCYYIVSEGDKNARQISIKGTTILYDAENEPFMEVYFSRKKFHKLLSTMGKDKYILHLASEEDIQKINVKISRE